MKIKKILPRIRQALDPVAYVKDSIIAKQAVEIDRLQMQCDWLEQLAIIEGDNLRKVVSVGRLWEPNDIY